VGSTGKEGKKRRKKTVLNLGNRDVSLPDGVDAFW
jgi:hypothetical protein